MDCETLLRVIGDFLAESNAAVVVEDGEVCFDLAAAKYSISGERNKCLLHLWSAERNVVRRVLNADLKKDVLRLAVQRLGQSKPTKLEVCRERDRRAPTARRASRAAYQHKLRRILQRSFPEFSVERLSTAMDLEHSFGPVYARGWISRGQSASAVLGVNGQESQASIDASLAFGILWLQVCRGGRVSKSVVEGLKLFVPAGCSQVVREHMALLREDAAKWRLYEFDEHEDSLREIDLRDMGNVATRLVHAIDEASVRRRFAEPIARVRALMPEAEIVVTSAADVVFRCHGLQFAHARLSNESGSFRSITEIVFGLGSEERVLSEGNSPRFTQLVRSIGEVRHAEGPRDHRLWRLHPERWLESLIMQNVTCIDARLDCEHVYSQVPAFAASDRGMIDVLTVTKAGRLAVIEIKAGEDIQLPMQGLDYWSRVAWHHERGEFHRFGYFQGKELSPEPPLLLFVAPALHVHPATDTLLRHISPRVEWELIGIDERWRMQVRTVFRKRSSDASSGRSRDAVA